MTRMQIIETMSNPPPLICRQLSLILKAGYDPNLMLNGRGQNGLQYMVHYFGASEAHMMRLEIPAARAAYFNIAKLLLDSGLDPNATDLLTGESVIFDAIRLNDRDLVGLLLHYVSLELIKSSTIDQFLDLIN